MSKPRHLVSTMQVVLISEMGALAFDLQTCVESTSSPSRADDMSIRNSPPGDVKRSSSVHELATSRGFVPRVGSYVPREAQ